MKIKTLLLFILLGIITIFVVLNWNEFLKPTTLSLWYQTIEAPLGLIMLSLIILLSSIFGVFALYLKTSLLIKERSLTKELKDAQEIANNAEVSRFTELKSLIESEFRKYHELISENFQKILDEVNHLTISNKSNKP